MSLAGACGAEATADIESSSVQPITALFTRASSTGVDARLICERSRFNSSCADPEVWLAGGWRQSYELRRTVPSRFDSSVSDAQVYLNW